MVLPIPMPTPHLGESEQVTDGYVTAAAADYSIPGLDSGRLHARYFKGTLTASSLGRNIYHSSIKLI